MTRVASLRTAARDPVLANSSLMIATTLVMAAAGSLFWLIAARLQTSAEVGLSGSLVSAAVTMSYLAQLGINITLIRALPTSARSKADVTISVSLVALFGFMLALGYGFLLPVFSPHLSEVLGVGWRVVAFGVLVAATAVNLLTDGIFLGISRVGINLKVNGFLMGASKLALVFVFGGLGAFGLFGAVGMASLLAAVASVAAIMRVLPGRASLRPSATLIRQRRFAGAGYVASVLDLLPQLVLPLLIINASGASPSAMYFVSFQVVTLLNSGCYAIGSAMYAEGARSPHAVRQTVRRAGVVLALAVGTGVLTLLVVSPFLLKIFGPEYYDGGVVTLRVLAIGSVGVAFNYWAAMRLRLVQHLRAMMFVQLATSTVMIGAAAAVADRGPAWVAGAWGVGQLCGGLLGYLASKTVAPLRDEPNSAVDPTVEPPALHPTDGPDPGISARSVLIVSHYYEPHVGGVEAVARAAAVELARRGDQVSVLTSSSGAQPGRSTSDGVTLHRVRAWNAFEQRLGVPFPVLSPSLLVTAWLLVRKADVVHIHDRLYMTSWVAALVCRLQRRPYVVTQHVGVVNHTSSVVRAAQAAVHRTLGALVLRQARAVMPINAFIEENVQEMIGPSARIHVLGNGVDPDIYRPAIGGEREAIRREFGLPADEKLVLFVGRFVPKKGFHLVAACNSERYRLVFVGGDRPAGHPPDSTHIFLGPRTPEEVARIYRAVDLYVGASIGECPLVVLEALSSQLPVLLHEDAGYHALGVDGPGVHYMDIVGGDLEGELDRLVGDPSGLLDQGRSARRTALESCTWKSHVDQLDTIFRSLAS